VGVSVNDPFSETGNPAAEPTIWLSGEIVTPAQQSGLSAALDRRPVGLLGWVFLNTGRIAIASGFRLLAAFVVAATVFLLWFTARLQRVGYSGRELVRRQLLARGAYPVRTGGVGRARMVGTGAPGARPVRHPHAVRPGVYYLPKWGPLRLLLTPPDEELRGIIS